MLFIRRRATNGIPEIIVAILIVVPVIGALKKMYK